MCSTQAAANQYANTDQNHYALLSMGNFLGGNNLAGPFASVAVAQSQFNPNSTATSATAPSTASATVQPSTASPTQAPSQSLGAVGASGGRAKPSLLGADDITNLLAGKKTVLGS